MVVSPLPYEDLRRELTKRSIASPLQTCPRVIRRIGAGTDDLLVREPGQARWIGSRSAAARRPQRGLKPIGPGDEPPPVPSRLVTM
jgi:hypothetical protein